MLPAFLLFYSTIDASTKLYFPKLYLVAWEELFRVNQTSSAEAEFLMNCFQQSRLPAKYRNAPTLMLLGWWIEFWVKSTRPPR